MQNAATSAAYALGHTANAFIGASETAKDATVTVTIPLLQAVADFAAPPPDRRQPELIERLDKESVLDPADQKPTTAADHFGSDAQQLAGVQLFFISETYYGYPASPPDPFSHNLIQYILNNHPLLALFFHHPDNPFPSHKRFLHLFCTMSFTFMLTAVMSYGLYLTTSYCEAGCDVISFNYNATNCTALIGSGEDSEGCCVGNTVRRAMRRRKGLPGHRDRLTAAPLHITPPQRSNTCFVRAH